MSRQEPQLLLLGASHHTAPLEIRERFALAAEQRTALAASLRAETALREFCILGTCNRLEIYAVGDDPAAARCIAAALCCIKGIEPQLFAAHALERRGASVVAHLFAVAAGLDSQMVGEAEILGQVKDAYATACTAGHVGPVLNRVFQKAFQSAKLIRSGTSIGEGQVSVATVAVALAEKIFGELRTSRVLVIGAGDIAEKTAKALRSRGAGSISFANRTPARAIELAAEFGGAALPFAELGGSLARFDIVVSSTASPDPVLTLPLVSAAIRARASRPLFLIDLALPRDVAPAAAELPNVFLYNLDDLARLADENIAHRHAEIARARSILDGRAIALWHKLAPSDGTIAATTQCSAVHEKSRVTAPATEPTHLR